MTVLNIASNDCRYICSVSHLFCLTRHKCPWIETLNVWAHRNKLISQDAFNIESSAGPAAYTHVVSYYVFVLRFHINSALSLCHVFMCEQMQTKCSIWRIAIIKNRDYMIICMSHNVCVCALTRYFLEYTRWRYYESIKLGMLTSSYVQSRICLQNAIVILWHDWMCEWYMINYLNIFRCLLLCLFNSCA